jgi:hypothetical protein
VDGKFQLLESGSNVTGTHSHFVGNYLQIDTNKNPSAILYVTDNGDIVGGQKHLFTVNVKGRRINLAYAGCISQEYMGAKETPCTPKKQIGKESYTFETINNDLRMVWASDGTNDSVYKRVQKYDFEQPHS